MVSALLMVLVVNAWAWGFPYLMKWWYPRLGQDTLFGYYLVLMPIGFFAWSRPDVWVVAATAMLGLFAITRSVRKLMASANSLPPHSTSAVRS